eukprot:3967964-Amphidinium_carterae.2
MNSDAASEATVRETLVAQFVHLVKDVDPSSDIHAHLEDVGVGRAHGRCALDEGYQYKCFARLCVREEVCIPSPEQIVYDYVCSASARIVGAIEGIQAKVVVRRSPLTKDALDRLAQFVCDDSADPGLGQIAGFAVFLTHSRSRFSDALHPEAGPAIDIATDGDGYIEIYTGVQDYQGQLRQGLQRRFVAHCPSSPRHHTIGKGI